MHANRGMREINSWIFEAYGGWIYDDKNQTDLPEATTILTSGKDIYTLPVGDEYLRGVSIKDANGIWTKLKPITLEQIQEGGAEDEFYNVDGVPEYYRAVGNTIQLYPASNWTQADSLKVYISRDISSFVTTDTTKAPGFDNRFHEAIAVFMALQYAKINQMVVKTDLQRDWDGNEEVTGKEGGYKKMIKSYYKKKFCEMFPPKMMVRDTFKDMR